MGKSRLANPLIVINNEPVAIVPNSFKFDEGEGETTIETQMIGNKAEIVTSDSGEDKMSSFSFEMTNTEENIKLLRGLKKNAGNNVVTASQGSFSRVFQGASIANNYEVEMSATGKASVEWKSLPAI